MTVSTFRPIAILLAAATISACSTPQANYAPTITQFSRPPLGSTSTVSVGDEMVAQGNTSDQDGLELPSSVQISWAYTLSQGFYPKVGSDAKSDFYAFGFNVAPAPGYGALSKNALSDPPQAIKADKDGTNICVVTVFNLAACNPKAKGRAAKRAISSENAFQQTLIYNGRVGDKINIGYREFYGSAARPAFNNNVEYDLATSNTIAYRGARIQVITADNTSISYKLLSNFNLSK